MPMRLIQLILGKLGWSGDVGQSVPILPPGSVSSASAAHALCRIADDYVIPPHGEYGQMFDGVKGQDIVIEAAADGAFLVHLFEGDEDDGTELFEADAPLFQSPCRINYQLQATGYYTVLIENPCDESLHILLTATCPANVTAVPKKGPLRASSIASSAAAGAEGFGYRDAQDRDGNGKKGGLIVPGDPPEQSSVFVARDEADGQSEHSDPSGKKADGDIEPPA